MPIFFTWLATLLTPAFAWLSGYVGLRVAHVVFVLSVFAAAWLVLITALWALIIGVTLTLPSQLQILYFLIPPGVPALLTAKIAGDIAFMVYFYARHSISLISNV